MRYAIRIKPFDGIRDRTFPCRVLTVNREALSTKIQRKICEDAAETVNLNCPQASHTLVFPLASSSNLRRFVEVSRLS